MAKTLVGKHWLKNCSGVKILCEKCHEGGEG